MNPSTTRIRSPFQRVQVSIDVWANGSMIGREERDTSDDPTRSSHSGLYHVSNSRVHALGRTGQRHWLDVNTDGRTRRERPALRSAPWSPLGDAVRTDCPEAVETTIGPPMNLLMMATWRKRTDTPDSLVWNRAGRTQKRVLYPHWDLSTRTANSVSSGSAGPGGTGLPGIEQSHTRRRALLKHTLVALPKSSDSGCRPAIETSLRATHGSDQA